MKQNKILIIVLIISILANVLFGVNYFQNKNTQKNNTDFSIQERQKVGELTKFFVTKVIATGGQISFEDRAKIEEDIKALNDQNVAVKWSAFVASKNAKDAQGAAIELLVALTEKMI